MRWRAALVAARNSGLKLTLASVEGELRHRFMPILADGRFAVLGQPVDGPPIPKPKMKLQRIGFFGHQREEKGSAMMERLLSHLVGEGFSNASPQQFYRSQDPAHPGD